MGITSLKSALPNKPGTYILCLQLKQTTQINIGKLGTFNFKKGFYFYVGSAFGPGGIRARCGHHIKIASRPRWHIDYLRQHCELEHIIYSDEPQHLEHQWADFVLSINSVEIPAIGFGSSDCHCNSHLFFCCSDKTQLILGTNKYIISVLNEAEIS